MKGPAMGRGKISLGGIDQIQRYDTGQDLIEENEKGGIFKGVNRFFFGIFYEFLDLSLINPAIGGIHRNFKPGGQDFRGLLGIQNGGHPEFTGQGGHMAGRTAQVGYNAFGFGHNGHQLGRGGPGH